ncbi:MAG: trypsin-like peptidase domain-containing protein [Candidatus Micrarchaeota archaeon]
MKAAFGIILVFAVLSAGCVGMFRDFGPANVTGPAATPPGQDDGPAAGGNDLPQTIESLKRGVVHINYSGESEDYWYGSDFSLIGSGVVYKVEDGKAYVLTNRHVVDLSYPDGFYSAENEKIAVKTYANDTFFATERFFAPRGVDLAIVTFEKGESELESVELADSLPRTGEEVLVIGMPEQLEWSVSKGIVSGIREFETEKQNGQNYTAIQTDAAVNEGNSGGGMFTMDGELVGINAWKYVGFGVEGLNFAIASTDFAKEEAMFASRPIGTSGASKQASGLAPVEIGIVDVYREYDYYGGSDWYEVSFTLMDQNGDFTTADGKAKVTFIDDAGKALYSKSMDVKSSDFASADYYPFYGKKAYGHEAYFDEFNKSAESYYANVTVEFQSGGKTMKKTTEIYLPYDLLEGGSSYDDNYSYYDNYGTDFKDIGIASSDGGVEVKLVKGGMSSGYYYDDYTLVAEIKNLGSAKKEIEIMDAVLVTKGKQYEGSSYYDDDLGTVYPSAAVDHDFYFYYVEDLGKDATFYLELRVIEGERVETLNYAITFST